MLNNRDIAKIALEEYHSLRLVDTIAKGFGDDSLQKSSGYWDSIHKILNSGEPFSLGLRGSIKLFHGNISHGSPMYLLTDRLTNPKEYSVQSNRLDDLTLFGFSDGSLFLLGMNNVSYVNPIRSARNMPSNGITIGYKNRVNTQIEDGELSDLTLMSNEISGFYVPHNQPKVYSLESINESFLEEINFTHKK